MNEEFVLAVYAKHLQNNWRGTVNQPDLLTILFNAVAMPLGLKNKNYPDYQIEKDKATKIFNRITGGNAPRDIRKNAGDRRVTSTIAKYFQDNVTSNIQSHSLPGLVYRLNLIIQQDDFFSLEEREKIATLAKDKKNSSFLAFAFLLSLQPSNVLKSKKEVSAPEGHAEDLVILREKLAALGKRISLPGLEKPDEPDLKEIDYLAELYKAYGSHMGKNVEKKADLSQALKMDLEVRRADFYSAETVLEQGVDALQGLTQAQFDILKREVLESVYDVYVESLDWDGFECMKKVMHRAAELQYHKSLFCDVGWIDAPEKRGICHMLAGEKELPWVVDYE